MGMIPKNLYGYGTSVLSFKNKKNALDNELIGNKDIGLIGIFHAREDSDGYINSALYTTRIKNHLNNFLDTCIKDNTIGDIYKININDELVKVIPYSMNLFDNTVSFRKNNNLSSFRFNIDFDLFDKINNVVFKAHNIRIRVGFSLIKANESKDYYIDESLEDINKKAFKFDFSEYETQEDNVDYTVTLNTMEILLPSEYDNKTNVLVIYDILMALV